MHKITSDEVQRAANQLGTSAEEIIEIAVLLYLKLLQLDQADMKTIVSLLSKRKNENRN